MQATTWIDRITDDSKPWLNAVRSQDQHDLIQAATLYLNDASISMGQGQPVWGALSCACAADCLSDVGLYSHARLLYRESASIYLERADSTALTSVREVLWSLRQAYQFFLLADDGSMAGDAYRRMLKISRRIDPFSVDAPFSVPENGGSPREHQVDREAFRGSEVAAEVERFLKSRATGQYDAKPPDSFHDSIVPKSRRVQENEKSIINQLG